MTLPTAVKKLSRGRLVEISVLLIVVAPVVRYCASDTPYSLGSLLLAGSRADALAAGFLCAAVARSKFVVSSGVLSVAAICLGGLVAASHVAGSLLECLRGTSLLGLYSCILLLAVRGSIPVLRVSVLRFFGTISYALYLVHQSALLLLHSIVCHRIPSVIGSQAIFASIAALLLSVAVCWFSWLYIEKPIVSWARDRFRY